MRPAALRRRGLRFRDLVLFYVATTFSLRWMASAAAAGPIALVVWIAAALGLFRTARLRHARIIVALP